MASLVNGWARGRIGHDGNGSTHQPRLTNGNTQSKVEYESIITSELRKWAPRGEITGHWDLAKLQVHVIHWSHGSMHHFVLGRKVQIEVSSARDATAESGELRLHELQLACGMRDDEELHFIYPREYEGDAEVGHRINEGRKLDILLNSLSYLGVPLPRLGRGLDSPPYTITLGIRQRQTETDLEELAI